MSQQVKLSSQFIKPLFSLIATGGQITVLVLVARQENLLDEEVLNAAGAGHECRIGGDRAR